MSALQSIVRAYFENEPASHEIFSDYLQDFSLPRLRHVDGSSARLRLVIERFLDETERNLLACDFAQHAVDNVCSSIKGRLIASAAQKAIEAVRNWLSQPGEKRKRKAKRMIEEVVAEFRDPQISEFKKEARGVAASYVGTTLNHLLLNVPFSVMMQAQYTSKHELQWQMEHTIDVIVEKIETIAEQY